MNRWKLKKGEESLNSGRKMKKKEKWVLPKLEIKGEESKVYLLCSRLGLLKNLPTYGMINGVPTFQILLTFIIGKKVKCEQTLIIPNNKGAIDTFKYSLFFIRADPICGA